MQINSQKLFCSHFLSSLSLLPIKQAVETSSIKNEISCEVEEANKKKIKGKLYISNAILSAQSEACGEIHDAKVLSSEKETTCKNNCVPLCVYVYLQNEKLSTFLSIFLLLQRTFMSNSAFGSQHTTS